MNLKEALSLSKFHMPGGKSEDPQVQKAIRMVATDPSLKAAFDTQVEFDGKQGRLVDSIKPGEDLLEKIDTALEDMQQKGFQWSALRHPAFLATALAVLVVIGVLVYSWSGWMENFPGRESIEKILDTSDQMGSKGWASKTEQVGDLGDWFALSGYDDFHMLPQFAAMNATGARVFKQDGSAVAQIGLEDHHAILSVFHLQDFNVQLDPPDRWRLFQQGDWAVATRADNGTGYSLMFKGDKSDMQDFLNGLK